MSYLYLIFPSTVQRRMKLVHFRSTFIDSTIISISYSIKHCNVHASRLVFERCEPNKMCVCGGGGGEEKQIYPPPPKKITNENLQRIEEERGLAYQLSCYMSRDLYILTWYTIHIYRSLLCHGACIQPPVKLNLVNNNPP